MSTTTVKKISFMQEIKDLQFRTLVFNVFEDLNQISYNWLHPSISITAFFYNKTGQPLFLFKERNFLCTNENERFTLGIPEIIEIAIEESKKYDDVDEYSTYLILLKSFLCYRFNFDLKIGMERVSHILLQKNKQYGDAVLKPLRCFSKQISISEVIKSRLDEKINRLLNTDGDTEDTYMDIIGYLVFLCISLKQGENNNA